jgi:hypothetical protein
VASPGDIPEPLTRVTFLEPPGDMTNTGVVAAPSSGAEASSNEEAKDNAATEGLVALVLVMPMTTSVLAATNVKPDAIVGLSRPPAFKTQTPPTFTRPLPTSSLSYRPAAVAKVSYSDVFTRESIIPKYLHLMILPLKLESSPATFRVLDPEEVSDVVACVA